MTQATINPTIGPPEPPDGGLRDAYVFLEQFVGCIATALPAVLILGGLLLGRHELESSLSAYYYTPVGAVFIGALCALGVFFLSYQCRPLPGHRVDNRLSNLATAAAVGVAVFPTAEHHTEAWTGEWLVSTIHLVCAAALFVLLAYFAFFRFPEPNAALAPARRRNAIYRSCGWVIVLVIALVLGNNALHLPDSWNVLLWLETVGVVAFGSAWLVKSGQLSFLNDPRPSAELTQPEEMS
jgi:hypothetical protein